MNKIHDVIIIGSGPAGMTAAIYMARSGHSVLLFERLAAGGQAALTHSIDNYPGFENGINGMELSDKMRQQAERFGAHFEYDAVETLDYNASSELYAVVSSLGKEFVAKSVLITTGTIAKRLHAKGEDRYFGNGIGTCAVCDGAFYKDKVVAVIGGGNSALEESLYLAKIVKKVYVIHRRQEFRAEAFVQEQIKKVDNIEFVLDTVVEEFAGDKRLNKIILKNVHSNEIFEKEIDGAFLYVGLDANTQFVSTPFKNDQGFIKVDDYNNVDGKGLFAAGDCCAGRFKQVIIACGDAAKASYHISEYLNHRYRDIR
ncbi:MAG: NAD(P)/FAD-dependent oxidoreductase [Brevinema sp.]